MPADVIASAHVAGNITDWGIDMAEVRYADCSLAIMKAVSAYGRELSPSQCAVIMKTIAPFLDEAYHAGQEAERFILDALLKTEK